MREISFKDFNENIFELIGSKWMLISAEKNGVANTMTASWGGMGVIWNKRVATIYVRKSRFTKSFIDGSDGFSLCVFDEKYRKELGYCGRVSGRDEDKIKVCKFSVNHENGVPFFDEAKMIFICKKMYSQDFTKEGFVGDYENIVKDNYSDNDWHVMYIGEIEKILINN